MRGIMAAVDEDHARRRDAFEQAGVERGGRGRREAAPVQRAQRRVLPCFAAHQRQAVVQGGVERFAAGRVAFEARRQRVEQGAHAVAAPGATRSRSQA